MKTKDAILAQLFQAKAYYAGYCRFNARLTPLIGCSHVSYLASNTGKFEKWTIKKEIFFTRIILLFVK